MSRRPARSVPVYERVAPSWYVRTYDCWRTELLTVRTRYGIRPEIDNRAVYAVLRAADGTRVPLCDLIEDLRDL